MKLHFGLPLLPFAMLMSACIITDANDRENKDDYEFDQTRQLAQGYTPCNDAPDATEGVICTPNQYCGDQQLAWCFTGCLSDDNCSTEQICSKRPGRDVGTCIAWEDAQPIYDELEPGYTTCGDERVPSAFEICQPSQHCYSHRTGECAEGCLSEDNCTENQDCVKAPGENRGVCVAQP